MVCETAGGVLQKRFFELFGRQIHQQFQAAADFVQGMAKGLALDSVGRITGGARLNNAIAAR